MIAICFYLNGVNQWFITFRASRISDCNHQISNGSYFAINTLNFFTIVAKGNRIETDSSKVQKEIGKCINFLFKDPSIFS